MTHKQKIKQAFLTGIERAASRPVKAARFFRSVVPVLPSGAPTFMEAPHSYDAPDSHVVVVGFPYEGIRARDTRTMVQPGVPLEHTPYARDGAWQAPDHIRKWSLHYAMTHGPGLHHFELDHDYRVGDALTVSDAGDLPARLEGPTGPVVHEAVESLSEIIGASRIPILLGGEDITPYVGVSAVARQRRKKIAVIKFDAHFDLCWEPRYWAGSAWARCMEEGTLDPENLAIIGIRGLRNPTFFAEVARELGVHFSTISDIEANGIVHCVRTAIDKISQGADYLYVSFDVDVMDPAFLPAQKYPEPAGMTSREAVNAIRTAVIEGPPFCGFDIDCLAPAYDVNGLGGQLAARLAFESFATHGYRMLQNR